MIKLHSALPLLAAALMIFGTTACTSQKKSSKAKTLGNQEVLFNGKNTDGWHTFNKGSVDPCWRVEDGALTFDPEYDGEGDLVTDKTYENYILSLEWKISPAGNSGILINVQEGPQFSRTYISGPEMQVLDNKDASDNKKDNHLAGSLYDLISCNPDFVHPAGAWNKVKIKQNEGHLTFWINDHKVMNIQIGSSEWNNLVAQSKFGNGKYKKYFGKFSKGHIALQDHGHKVWYRNIHLQEL